MQANACVYARLCERARLCALCLYTCVPRAVCVCAFRTRGQSDPPESFQPQGSLAARVLGVFPAPRTRSPSLITTGSNQQQPCRFQ